MRAWLVYAAAAAAASLVAAGIGALLVGGADRVAVLVAAAVAYVVQLAAFAGLVAVRGQPSLFLAGWAGGMVLRFAALGVMALWLSRSGALPLGPALITLAGVLFVLLLLEPIFLRWDLRAR